MRLNWVADLMMENEWRLHLLEAVFHPILRDKVLNIHIPCDPDKDRWIWTHTSNGQASFISAYRFVKKDKHEEGTWSGIYYGIISLLC